MGPPKDLVLFLKRQTGARFFVETGTFRCETAEWAGRHFEHVFTVELSPSYHENALKRFANTSTVEPLQGNSAEVLEAILGRMSGSAIFWLDAHWSGLDTAGVEHECPLLDELGRINASASEHVVMVDDARLFCAPPPAPHRAEDWPDLITTLQALAGGGRRHVVLFDDVLVAVPQATKGPLVGFLRQASSRNRNAKPWWRLLFS